MATNKSAESIVNSSKASDLNYGKMLATMTIQQIQTRISLQSSHSISSSLTLNLKSPRQSWWISSTSTYLNSKVGRNFLTLRLSSCQSNLRWVRNSEIRRLFCWQGNEIFRIYPSVSVQRWMNLVFSEKKNILDPFDDRSSIHEWKNVLWRFLQIFFITHKEWSKKERKKIMVINEWRLIDLWSNRVDPISNDFSFSQSIISMLPSLDTFFLCCELWTKVDQKISLISMLSTIYYARRRL